jgi:hypothetical protein
MATHDDGKNRPELITLWVVVPVAVHAAAERLAIAYAEEGAEEVCAAVLHGLAEAEAGAQTLDARLLGGWLCSHPWPRDDAGTAKKEGA